MATARSLRWVAKSQRLVSVHARELAVLREEWQRSTLGELRVALVLGEPGMGKTRLATELVPHAVACPVGLLAHRCLSHSLPPVWQWAKDLGAVEGPDGDRACRVCGSGLGHLSPVVRGAGTEHDPASCADALRYHLVEWIPGLLATACKQRPTVLVLDDVHLGDDAVWQMLLRLGRDCLASRLLVLATARPADLANSPTALEAVHVLEHDARIRRIRLGPLSRQDIRELAADTLGQDQVPAALVDWLTAHAQGNAGFAAGLLEALVEGGANLHAPALDRVPARLARWIRMELVQVDPPVLAVLELLAVAGEVMDLDDLAAIAELPAKKVAVILEQLSRAGTVIEQQHAGFLGYKLAQVLAQDVLYGDIGAARRRLLHQQVAVRLLASGRCEAATLHYLRAAQAGDGEAIVALIELVRRALVQGSDALAWRVVSTLREVLPAGDERWNRVFDAFVRGPDWAAGDRTEHYAVDIAAVQRMRQLLPRVTDLHRQTEYRLWLARLFAYGAGNAKAGIRECWQASALCQQAGCGAAARSAAIELAKIQGWAGDLRGEEVAARQLLSDAEQAGDQRGIAEALAALGHSLGWQGQFDAAEKVLLRSIDVAAAAEQLSWRAPKLALLACLDACRGDLISARARCARAAASSSADDATIGCCGEFIELLAGDLIMAQAYARHAQRPEPASGTPAAVRLACRAAMAAAERSELAEARQRLSDLRCIDNRTLGMLEPLYWWAEGVVARAEDRLSSSVIALWRAVEGYATMGAYAVLGFAVVDLAEVTVCAGDGQTVASVAQWAQDSVRATGAPIHQTLRLLALAWTLIGRGRHEAAAQAALRAVEGFDSRGYELLAARARVSYARAIWQHDRGTAQQVLSEAAAAFQACGATLRHQQALAPLRQRTPVPSLAASAGCGSESLTLRERQVVELAVEGYTAAQIATQLRIGVRTVETHLANSYRKLGVSGKPQLIRRAAQYGFTHRAKFPGSTDTFGVGQ